MRILKLQGVLLGLMLFLIHAQSLQAVQPVNGTQFEHDAKSSESGSGPDTQRRNAYIGSSGVVFLSNQTIVQYVLRSAEDNLLQRHEEQVSSSYVLTISLFDLDQKKAIAKNDISVPGKTIQLFRSRNGNLILFTSSWVALLSPQLQVLHQVQLSERFGDGYVSAAIDINGAHLYLSGTSDEECPVSVQVLDSESLLTQSWWCLKEQANSAFYGNTAVQYHERRDSTLQIYNQGIAGATLHPPGLIVAAEAIMLPNDLLLVSNGGALLGYHLGKGMEFFAPVMRRWNIVSPISCDATGDNCAMALAIPKSDTFDVARETTYKDVEVAVVSSRDGSVRFRQSIRAQFSDSSRINLHSLSDVRITMAPDGKRVGVWHGSVWDVYAVQ